jgi:hypothetical protein
VHIAAKPRVGDAERDAVLERLRDCFASGRLSPAEHDARQEAALAAMSTDDLALLTKDLPAQWKPPAAPPVSLERAKNLMALSVILLAAGIACLFSAGTAGETASAILFGLAQGLMIIAMTVAGKTLRKAGRTR